MQTSTKTSPTEWLPKSSAIEVLFNRKHKLKKNYPDFEVGGWVRTANTGSVYSERGTGVCSYETYTKSNVTDGAISIC